MIKHNIGDIVYKPVGPKGNNGKQGIWGVKITEYHNTKIIGDIIYNTGLGIWGPKYMNSECFNKYQFKLESDCFNRFKYNRHILLIK